MTHSEIAALKHDIFSSLHCALPGTVVAFDPQARTADILPAVKQRPPALLFGLPVPDAEPLSLPLLRDVPVFMPVPFEITPGDVCLVIFADCDIDAWLDSGEPAVPPSGRMHSLSDGFAFVGFRTRDNQGG